MSKMWDKRCILIEAEAKEDPETGDLILETDEDTPVRLVVKCRDCIHNVANWEHEENDATDYSDIVCDYFMTDGMDPEDFCSKGER